MGGFDSDSSAFNMAVMTLQRMNYFLIQAAEARETANGVTYYQAMVSLYTEVHAYLSRKMITHIPASEKKEIDTERAIHEKMFSDIKALYTEYFQSKHNYEFTISRYPKFKNMPFFPPNKLLDNLHDFELSLRESMRKHNMLIPYKEKLFAPSQNKWE